VGIVLAALLVGLCGVSQVSAAGGGGGKAAAVANTDVTVTLAYEKAQTGGMDPHLSSGVASSFARFPVYETLIDVDGNGNLAPGLATSWKYINATTLQLQLRQGVKFTDGTPFNADAVRENFDYDLKVEQTSSVPEQQLLQPIRSVRVEGPYTVRFLLYQANYDFVYNLTDNIGMMISPKFLASGANLQTNAVGTGLYKLTSYNPTVGGVYTVNSNYWDKARLATAPQTLQTVQVASSSARLNGALAGQYDITYVDGSQIKSAEDGGLRWTTKASLAHYAIWFNLTRNPAFAKQYVREAFMYGIDRAAIVKGLTNDTGIATDQIFSPHYFAYSPKQPVSLYAYNPTKAKQLLAAAGYANGLTISMQVGTATLDQQIAQAVQQELAAAGITVNVSVDANTNSFGTEDKYDAELTSISGRADPLASILLEVPSNAVMNPAQEAPPQKMTALINEEEATPLTQQAKRTQILQELSALDTSYALSVPIMMLPVNYVNNPCLVDFHPPIFGPPVIGDTYWKAGCSWKGNG
jgi:peptide/nickel transport system substrate-binding protein